MAFPADITTGLLDTNLNTNMGTITPSTGSSSGCSTPTTEHYPSIFSFTIQGKPQATPAPNNTYMITDAARTRALTLVEGKLHLLGVTHKNMHGGSWYWRCIERDGWLGFRNTASGTYLGHDGRRNVQASAPHHKNCEQFCVRRHPNGGYMMLLESYGLKKVTYTFGKNGGDGKWWLTPIGDESDEIVWHFTEIGGWEIAEE